MMCFILPTCLGALWGDALGGYLYGGFVSRIILWHTTWFINSLAHSWGEQEFSAENTSRGNHIIALLTMGEGHHNYHHEFPRDYRNGILAIDYDPTKWLIIALSYFGLTYDLIKIPAEVILKARVNACKDKIHEWNKHLIWSDEDKLPTWSYEEFANEAAQSKSLILIQDFAIDITEFASQHPGGEKLLNNYVAKDATKAFFGVLNNHTKSARQLMKDMRVAKVSDKPKQD
jgi:stearoyl-CoA desaturase (delta-9 desaturase)